MISDFSNPGIKNPNSQSIAVSQQSQQPVSPAQKLAEKALRASDESTLKFPNDEQIASQVETALSLANQGNTVPRGSIVNILA